MKVVVLCGGLGTRLREETEFRPKPMVEIGDRPILWHIMKVYAHYGASDFALALGYKGGMIKNYFFHYELMINDVTIELGKPDEIVSNVRHEEQGWRITMADTGQQALKGARLKKLEKYVPDDTFMVTYGDGLSDINLSDLLAFHHSHGKLATVTGVNPTARFGELRTEENRVMSCREKPRDQETFVNGGFFVFNRKIFDYLDESDDCDLEVGPLEEIAQAGELMVYKHTGFWACMDNLRDVAFLNDLWDRNEAPWKVW